MEWGMGSPLNIEGRFESVRAIGPRDHQLHFVLKRNARKRAHDTGVTQKTSELYILSPTLLEHSWICLR